MKKRFTMLNICAILEKYLQKTVNYCKIKSIYKTSGTKQKTAGADLCFVSGTFL
jgi:hypothetical protein